jgi:hypothetical protein
MLSAIMFNCFDSVNIFKLMADEILPPWWSVMIIAQHQSGLYRGCSRFIDYVIMHHVNLFSDSPLFKFTLYLLYDGLNYNPHINLLIH